MSAGKLGRKHFDFLDYRRLLEKLRGFGQLVGQDDLELIVVVMRDEEVELDRLSKLGGDLSLARVGISEMSQCPDDLLDAIPLMAQEVAVLLELGLRPRAVNLTTKRCIAGASRRNAVAGGRSKLVEANGQSRGTEP
ncbi:MAG: hypothetical protein ACREXX_10425 [Gammaproteobacteria bacterium]